MTFYEELTKLLNKYSIENKSNTPDFILGQYLVNCLKNFNDTVSLRNTWFRNVEPNTINEVTKEKQ